MKEAPTRQAVQVIGAGLAGCEAAWQLASRQVPVVLIDMKPDQLTPAHQSTDLAELVCSNSLRSDRLENAVGLLKEEMRRLGSLIMHCADRTRVPAGGALAVDRQAFSRCVTEKIDGHPLITRQSRLVSQLPDQGLAIVATGPLTDGALFDDIRRRLDTQTLSFFDAAAPIVLADSIDQTKVFRQSRYNRGSADYLNAPLTQEAYARFVDALLTAQRAPLRDFDQKLLFEGCMPIEQLAQRGHDTLRFGPLKPVGLIDPATGQQPYACVQLRQDDRLAHFYNLVGFQTQLTFPEQRRVFGLIPGLENAQWARYGVMHRNTFLDAPRHLDQAYQVRGQSGLYFAGQITGVEGYVESAASGLVAGRQAALQALGVSETARRAHQPGPETVLGALAAYISDPAISRFQPMKAHFGLLAALPGGRMPKKKRLEALIQRSLAAVDALGLLQMGTADV